ncbi:unnamed protein product [Pleuronectes platessa]|uniref:Uncharacterized protein n=1 Tax=Pleuronectes platessa TaxID=8262 RepID=A0A9N7VWA2_PLEPL|nr:unnamed protein product [Pleuronectes platessa]
MMADSEAAEGRSQCGRRMIFTGPDGIGDYRPRSNYFPLHIGEGASSPEATGDLSYLCRAGPSAPPPRPRQSYVGEVGWGWQYNQLLNSGRCSAICKSRGTGHTARASDTKEHSLLKGQMSASSEKNRK